MSTFFWTEDPSLAVTKSAGRYCRFRGRVPIFLTSSASRSSSSSPESRLFRKKEAMRKWCTEHMASLYVKRFYDGWLETIRIGLLAGLLPDPARDFSRSWNIISGVVKPAYLANPPATPGSGMMDSLFDFRAAKIRILSGLRNDALGYLLKKVISLMQNTRRRWKPIPGSCLLCICRIRRPTSDKKGLYRPFSFS